MATPFPEIVSTARRKIALSHDWLNGMRGGEKCLEVFSELFPESPIYTLFCERSRLSGLLRRRAIRTSFIQHLPWSGTAYRYYLPLFPKAVESFDMRAYDVILSSSHCAAKGVLKNKEALHICYCFTPMRYAWLLFEEYFGRRPALVQRGIRAVLERLKRWDYETNRNIDHFVAISHNVAERIARFYGRAADVIYPPVDTEFYRPEAGVRRENFYLVVSALVPYKRVALAVEACRTLKRPLKIIGAGPELAALKKKAPDTVEFLGWQPAEVLRDAYRRARALLFPGEEDFGIVPLEAQGCGCFVIALGKGGALETIVPGKTGRFFAEPTTESLADCLREFEKSPVPDPAAARENALRFSRERFKKEISAYLQEKLFCHHPS